MAEVLLVDDDGSVLLTLAIALRRQGHGVTVAGDAAQAMTHLAKTNFDFMISDVRMPGVSGLELAARARDLPQPPRVILTSAYPFVENREAVSEAFMQKPLDVGLLSEYLNSGDDKPGGTPPQATAPPPAPSDSTGNDAPHTPDTQPEKPNGFALFPRRAIA
jgi:CheY-like chemotaxis protein